MNTYKTEGIVLKRRNIGEADRLLTVYTKKHGKIQLKAKGIRKIPSRRASHVELLNHTFLTIYDGRNMPLLTEAVTLEDFSDIKQNLQKIAFAYHICELIDGLCAENQENASIFLLLQTTLMRLSKDSNTNEVIQWFEYQLLQQLGFSSPHEMQFVNTTTYIENILERKLKARKLITKLY